MVRVLESSFDIYPLVVPCLESLLHSSAVRDDVEAPSIEVGDLVLRLR